MNSQNYYEFYFPFDAFFMDDKYIKQIENYYKHFLIIQKIIKFYLYGHPDELINFIDDMLIKINN